MSMPTSPAHTPPLADRLTALDLVRQTLDRYLGGAPAYGLPGYIGVDDGESVDHESAVCRHLSLAVDRGGRLCASQRRHGLAGAELRRREEVG